MEIGKYSLSFTSATILHRESVLVADLYLRLGEWREVRDRVISENLLQARTLNTSKRIYREIASRLKTCSIKELDLLVKGTLEEQRNLLWLTVCRRYQFIGDFSMEVLRERALSLRFSLDCDDFDTFFNRKAEWHDELEKIQPSTKKKLRQFLFKMLREVGFLIGKTTINPIILSPRLLKLMAKNNYEDIRFFPTLDSHLIPQK
jgi:hypothetical protein